MGLGNSGVKDKRSKLDVIRAESNSKLFARTGISRMKPLKCQEYNISERGSEQDRKRTSYERLDG
jgi:hypothetical protein